ncbi:MAG: hypothetical protein OXO50_08200 [Caldilineaceae bacterium]|nr:hypothetical protein [Caldilineaceae bacterium]
MTQDDNAYQQAGERACSQDTCPECECLREKLKWCIDELFKWHDFCAAHNINPFAVPQDHSEEVSQYFDVVLLNTGVSEEDGVVEDDEFVLSSQGCVSPGFS